MMDVGPKRLGFWSEKIGAGGGIKKGVELQPEVHEFTHSRDES